MQRALVGPRRCGSWRYHRSILAQHLQFSKMMSSAAAASSSANAASNATATAAAMPSTAGGSDAILSDTVVTPAIQEMATASFKELGLCHWTPPGLFEYLYEIMHLQYDMPWWAIILTTTCLARTALLPVSLRAFKYTARYRRVAPEVQAVSQQVQAKSMDPKASQEDKLLAIQEMRETMRKYDVSPLKALLPPVVSAFIFIPHFMALNHMTKLVPSFNSGGLLWFQNLAACDPYYVLPALTAGSMYVTSIMMQKESASQSPKWLAPGMSAVVGAVSLFWPAGTNFYFFVSNAFAFAQSMLFRSKVMQRLFGYDYNLTPVPTTPTKALNGSTPSATNQVKSMGFMDAFRMTVKAEKERYEREKEALPTAAPTAKAILGSSAATTTAAAAKSKDVAPVMTNATPARPLTLKGPPTKAKAAFVAALQNKNHASMKNKIVSNTKKRAAHA